MAIQARRGNEVDFDATKMLPGEWAVSLDTKYVRMCFAPGVCLRMATYEGFEEDMAKIEAILKECQDIEEAVSKIQSEINAVAIEVEELAASAEENALKSQSYAVGGTGTRENENIDNAKYYYNQVKQVSQSINGIIPMGTVTFAELPQLSVGDSAFMYNISDDFVSDERFNDGGGVSYGAGNNVFWTAEGKWDVTASSAVNGIKGSAEEDYRTGNVTITPEDLGLGDVQVFNMTTSSSDQYYKPWLVIQEKFADMPIGTFLYGTIYCGYTYFYSGYILNDKFASFAVHSYYTKYDYHVYLNNGTWSYEQRAIESDLAKYLPFSGGTLTGNLTTKSLLPSADAIDNMGYTTLAYNVIFAKALALYKGGKSHGGLQVLTKGTESVNGIARLVLGNSTASGTENNALGDMLLYGNGTSFTRIYPTYHNSGDEYVQVGLPNTSGVLALQSEVQALETRIAQLEAALLTLSQE